MGKKMSFCQMMSWGGTRKKMAGFVGSPFFYLILPRIHPADGGLSGFEVEGEPDVTAVYGVVGSPSVAHVDEAVFVAGDGEDVCAL